MKPPLLVTVMVFGIACLSIMLYLGHDRYESINEEVRSANSKQNSASSPSETAAPLRTGVINPYSQADRDKITAEMSKRFQRLRDECPNIEQRRADAVKKGLVRADRLQEILRTLDDIKANPKDPKREKKLTELTSALSCGIFLQEEELYIVQELQKYYLIRKKFSPSLASIAGMCFQAMGDYPSAIQVLKEAITAVQREDLAIDSWSFERVITAADRAAVVKDLQDEIRQYEDLMNGVKKPRSEVRLPPEPGAITCLPQARVREGSDVSTKQRQAADAASRGDLPAAIKMFSSINDMENVAACKIRETYTQPRRRAVRMLGNIYKEHHDTVQGRLALREKGAVLRQLGDTKEAIECFERYLASNPPADTVNNVLLSLGQMQQEAGKTKDAIESFKQLHEQYQKDGWVGLEIVTTLADLLKQEGRQEEGAAVLDTALSNLENQRAEISSVAPMMEINKVRSMEHFRQFVEDYKKADCATGRQSQQ